MAGPDLIQSSKSLLPLLANVTLGLFAMGCGVPEAERAGEELGQAEQGLTVVYGLYSESGAVNSGAPVYRHQVQLTHGGACYFRTNSPSSGGTPLGDSQMKLFDAANNLLAENDDDESGTRPGTTFSRIDRTLPSGTYYVDVKSYKATAGGSYSLEVFCDPLVKFYQAFFAVPGGDVWQCQTYAWGTYSSPMVSGLNEWSPAILVDADGRPGGCAQSFGIVDPTNMLSGLNINLNFWSDGNPEQCKFQSSKAIPISNTNSVVWRDEYIIDTGSSAGGCWQEFSMSGRSDVALDIEFLATGNADQCNNWGYYTIMAGQSVRYRLNTDGRAGGCTQRFRLRKL